MPNNLLSHLNPSSHISARIGLSIASLALFLSILSSLIIGNTAESNAKESIGHSMDEIAAQMSDKIDRGMFERFREIQIMTTWPGISDYSGSSNKKREMLEKLKTTYPVHSWIGLTDDKGTVIAATGGLLEGQDVSERPWFTGARYGPYVGDVHGALLLSRHLPRPPNGDLRFVDFAAPLYDKNLKFQGVLCSHLNWEWASEIELSLFQLNEDHLDRELFILNKEGEMVLGPPALTQFNYSEMYNKFVNFSGQHKHFLHDWPDGLNCVTSFSLCTGYRVYPGLGWIIVSREPSSRAFASARKLKRDILIDGALMGTILALLGWLVSIRLSRPIRSIAIVANSISKGNRSVHIDPLPGKDEIAVLSRSFSEMLTTLEKQKQEVLKARDSLEEKVAERTLELKTANQQLKGEIEIRLKAEESLRRKESHLKEAQKIAQVGSMEIDNASGTIYWSEQLFRLFGYEPYSIVPTLLALEEHLNGDDAARFFRLLKGELSSKDNREFHIKPGNGPSKIFLVRESALSPKGKEGSFTRITFMDISDRKKSEELKSEVDRIMRHDLKSPLNAIINFPDVIIADPNLTDSQKKYLQLIQEAGYRMLNQINQSLNLYKMEMGIYRVDYAPVEIIHLIKHIAQELAAMAKGKGVFIKVTIAGKPLLLEDSFAVNGEEHLLYTMLSNLIKNSIEASPVNEVVTIDLDREDKKWTQISFHNESLVPPEIGKAFFEKYISSGKNQGTGLGNYSARLIAEAHNGTISFTTSAESGTTVSVKFPI